jgi:hypothetical protein
MATDFVRDLNPKPLYFAGLNIELPDYLQDYTIPTEDEIVKLSSAAFADKKLKLHPIHTKEAALMSAIYLQGTGLGDSPQMHHVKQAAAIFGVSEDLETIITQMENALEKSASSNNVAIESYGDTHAILVETEEGGLTACYPMRNEVQLQKSAQNLYEDFMHGRIVSDWAHKAAVNLVKKAHELGMERSDLPERVWVLGTERLPDFDVAEKMASMRDYDGSDKEAQTLYQDIVKAAREDQDNLEEYIRLWEDLDRTQGISYRDTFTPQEAIYTGPALSDLEKMSSQVVFVKDVMVPQDVFSKLASASIESTFRSEIADVITSAVTLAKEEPALASQYIAALDEENQDLLLEILV